MAPPWTNAWDETKPADTDLSNTLGTQGRQHKLDERQRLDWQHVWNQNVNDDGGHRFVLIATAYHPANTESFKASGFSLTGSAANSVVDLAGTWNTTGVATGFKLNIVDSASDATSLLMDLQISGSSKFSVSKAGVVKANGVTLSSGAYATGFGALSTILAIGTAGNQTVAATQATTDLFVWGWIQGATSTATTATCLSDSSNPPTTGVADAAIAIAASGVTPQSMFFFTVKKNDYFKIVITGDSNTRCAVFARAVS